ncbi:hypothetical protein CON13_28970 [Bacillus cereus]|uniref:HEPN domain-containing protein n=1 Tax=Bacillus cereus TaxID=1396 RepID=UPI000BEB3D16|nr:HEPN domain-containing protein [Bacillus cereus]PED28695.1 hypothetical protein CON13_28970 [Bacillus cereus]
MTDKPLKIEYLIIVDTKSAFCANTTAFNNLLRANSDIQIRGGKLKYKEVEAEYKVHTNQSEKGNQRFFNIELGFEELSRIEEYEKLLRAVREMLYKVDNHPQVLWDDFSYYYSTKAYPLVYEIENLMRKLITKFMLTTVGLGWAKENIPEEVKDSVKESKEETPDYLYKTDFIQLANFLFKKYSSELPNKLLERLRDVKELKELTLDELKVFVPKSNWEKYFSKFVECDEEYLTVRWKKIYKLRNKIAHNSGITRSEYDQIVKLIGEVKENLQKAVDSLDKIVLSDLDKDLVVDNVAAELGGIIGHFLLNFIELDSIIQGKYRLLDPKLDLPKRLNFMGMANELLQQGKISDVDFQEIREIIQWRNLIVHGEDKHINTSTLEEINEQLERLNESFIGN